MRILSWLTLALVSAAVLIGCGEPATQAPEDDAFQKSLAEAAAKNPGEAPKGGRKGNAIPPEAKAGGAGAKPPTDAVAPGTGAKSSGGM